MLIKRGVIHEKVDNSPLVNISLAAEPKADGFQG